MDMFERLTDGSFFFGGGLNFEIFYQNLSKKIQEM